MNFYIKKTIRDVLKYLLFPTLIVLHVLIRFFYGDITEMVNKSTYKQHEVPYTKAKSIDDDKSESIDLIEVYYNPTK